MNLAEIIRASFMATYPNPENIADVTPDVRFAAGASDAADAVLAHLRSLSPGERSDLAFGAWPEGAHVPRDPRTDDQSAGVAAEWDLADQTASEPEDERRRRHAGAGEDPFADHDRERITSLASETARHEAQLVALAATINNYARSNDREVDQVRTDLHGLTLSCHAHARRTTELEETTARHEAMLTEHDARLSALELLTHNVTELTRELRTLRNVTRRHREELDYITGEAATLPPAIPDTADPSTVAWQTSGHDETTNTPYQDDDQRLGGHDTPHPQPPENA